MVEISRRIAINVTRFKDKNWFHIFEQSNRSKSVSLNSDDLAALFQHKEELKSISASLHKWSLENDSTAEEKRQKLKATKIRQKPAKRQRFLQPTAESDTSDSDDASNENEGEF